MAKDGVAPQSSRMYGTIAKFLEIWKRYTNVFVRESEQKGQVENRQAQIYRRFIGQLEACLSDDQVQITYGVKSVMHQIIDDVFFRELNSEESQELAAEVCNLLDKHGADQWLLEKRLIDVHSTMS